MEFEHQAQEDLYARVPTYLRQGFGELAEPLEDEPAFWLDLGKEQLVVTVDANGPERASVLVYNVLGEGLSITPDVARFLLHKNHELPFGSLSLQEDGAIGFRHILFGETVTKDTLSILLRLLAGYSEEIEDELNMRFR
jgi:hypothetical protein